MSSFLIPTSVIPTFSLHQLNYGEHDFLVAEYPSSLIIHIKADFTLALVLSSSSLSQYKYSNGMLPVICIVWEGVITVHITIVTRWYEWSGFVE